VDFHIKIDIAGRPGICQGRFRKKSGNTYHKLHFDNKNGKIKKNIKSFFGKNYAIPGRKTH
jgi:hypothetical protein